MTYHDISYMVFVQSEWQSPVFSMNRSHLISLGPHHEFQQATAEQVEEARLCLSPARFEHPETLLKHFFVSFQSSIAIECHKSTSSVYFMSPGPTRLPSTMESSISSLTESTRGTPTTGPSSRLTKAKPSRPASRPSNVASVPMGPRRVRPKSDRGEQDETGGLRGGRGAEGKRRDPQGVYFLGDEEAFRMANEAAKLIGDGGYDVQGNPALQRQVPWFMSPIWQRSPRPQGLRRWCLEGMVSEHGQPIF